jgi:3-oxoacyl-[acyl-carrier protein] reductase
VRGLSGKVALVVGGSGGIGAAAAARLAAEGAIVAVASRSEIGCLAVVDEIRGVGGSAFDVTCDVTEAASIERAVGAALQYEGHLDILVWSVGGLRDNPLERMSEDEWDEVLDVHLRGAFLVARAAQRPMARQRSGKMVFVSSQAVRGTPNHPNYVAAKSGLEGFVRAIAVELGPQNINVNAVSPGLVRTAMAEHGARSRGVTLEEFERSYSERVPLRRMAEPDDVAGVIAFLASDDAAFISGVTIAAAGGP